MTICLPTFTSDCERKFYLTRNFLKIVLKVKYHRLFFVGVAAGLLSLLFPETNKCKMMETLEEAEMFYKTRKQRTDRLGY